MFHNIPATMRETCSECSGRGCYLNQHGRPSEECPLCGGQGFLPTAEGWKYIHDRVARLRRARDDRDREEGAAGTGGTGDGPEAGGPPEDQA